MQKKNGTFAGDIEISTTAILFGCNKRIYQQDYRKFKLINEYNHKSWARKYCR